MYISLLNILGAGDAAGMYCMLYVANDLVDFNRKKHWNLSASYFIKV